MANDKEIKTVQNAATVQPVRNQCPDNSHGQSPPPPFYINMGYEDGPINRSHENINYSKLQNGATSMGETQEMQPVNGAVVPTSTESINSNGKDMEREKESLIINRELLNQAELDERYDGGNRPFKTIRETLGDCKDSIECSGKCLKKKVSGLFPFLKIPQYYNLPADFVNDLIAGLTVGIMQIPQGMAYATLASLPPEYGLYTSLFPVIMYAFLGTSRHVSVGTFAVVSLMVGSSVDKFNCEEKFGNGGATTMTPDMGNMTTGDYSGGSDSNNDVNMCKVGVAAAVTFLGGCFQLLLGVTRLGFVTIYLSEAMTRGFTTGCAIHVFSSQIKSIFGVPVPSYYGPWKLIYTYRDLFKNITDTNVAALVLSIICMVILWCTKEYLNPPVKKKIKAPIPIDLVVVILGTVVSAVFDFEEIFNMDIVGYIPTGIPAPQFPDPEVMSEVIGDAIAVAIVGFAISVSMVQLFAKRHNYECDANQELIAHGSTNIVCSNLNCYMMCVSLSRSVVCESLGCKSQINAMWSGGLMLLVILFIATYFQALPSCVLASIIIVALKGMFMQFKDLPKYWRINKTDFSVWLVTFVAVVLLDVALGLVVGIAYSLLTVVATTQRPYSTLVGQIDNTEIYKDVGVYSKARELDGIKIFRFDGSIYFASKLYFVDCVYEKTGCDARRIKLQRGKLERKLKKEESKREKLKKKQQSQNGKQVTDLDVESLQSSLAEYEMPRPNMHHLIIDCSTMGYLDDLGVQGIQQVCTDYKDIGVTVFLSGCKAGVREMLVKGGFHDKFDKDIMFPTIHDAVIASRQSEGKPGEKSDEQFTSVKL